MIYRVTILILLISSLGLANVVHITEHDKSLSPWTDDTYRRPVNFSKFEDGFLLVTNLEVLKVSNSFEDSLFWKLDGNISAAHVIDSNEVLLIANLDSTSFHQEDNYLIRLLLQDSLTISKTVLPFNSRRRCLISHNSGMTYIIGGIKQKAESISSVGYNDSLHLLVIDSSDQILINRNVSTLQTEYPISNFSDILIDDNNDIVLLGYSTIAENSHQTPGLYNDFIIKTDNQFNVIWKRERKRGFETERTATGYRYKSVQTCSNGDYVILGETSIGQHSGRGFRQFAFRLSPDNEIVWTTIFDNSGRFGNHLERISDSTFVFGSEVNYNSSSRSNHSEEGYVCEFTENGEVITELFLSEWGKLVTKSGNAYNIIMKHRTNRSTFEINKVILKE